LQCALPLFIDEGKDKICATGKIHVHSSDLSGLSKFIGKQGRKRTALAAQMLSMEEWKFCSHGLNRPSVEVFPANPSAKEALIDQAPKMQEAVSPRCLGAA
jgi:hypothetical protein